MQSTLKIEDYEKLIWKVANKFYGVEKEDLYQAGMLGLLKACKNYKDNHDTKFSTYEMNYIFGEMYLLANNKNIKYSKDLLKLSKLIETTRYKLAQNYNRMPNNYELAKILNISIEDIEMVANIKDEIMSLDSAGEEERSYYETIPAENDNLDEKIFINDSLEKLSEAERKIIKFHYFEDMTQCEIARKLKMTQVMVSRYEKKGKEKLREYMSLSA